MKTRRLRILLTLGTVAVLCVLYAWFFGFQTAMVLETRWIARTAPIVKETPRVLADNSTASGPGTKLSYFGYDFEVPWDDLDPAQTRIRANMVLLGFRSGKSLTFSSGSPRHFVDAVSADIGQRDNLRNIYGDAPLQSDYAMWSVILAATPDKVSVFSSRQEIVSNSMLLTMKAVVGPEESGIFALQIKGFRGGFQWGDPARNPRRVVASLYADDYGLQFSFSGKTKKNPQGISQAEINRVLQTVRRSAESPTKSNSRPDFVAIAK
jgi:hypothetical protein